MRGVGSRDESRCRIRFVKGNLEEDEEEEEAAKEEEKPEQK